MKRGIIVNSKKAVSPIIGYILLISFVIIISTITFQWVKTYIPREATQCSEGVSVFVQDEITYDCDNPNGAITLNLKNNGRFNISGYFIRASLDPNQLATIDLSSYVDSEYDQGKVSFGEIGSTENTFGPGESSTERFTLFGSTFDSPISYLEIIPIRYESIEDRVRLASCNNAKIKQVLCENTCVQECGTRECGPDINDCGIGCGDPGETCGAKGPEFICNTETYTCENTCGNDVYNVGEECDASSPDPNAENCIPSPNVNQCTCYEGYLANGNGGCDPAPDLIVSVPPMGVTIGTGSNGNQITIQYSISNIGNADASDIIVRVNPGTTSTDPTTIQSGPFSLFAGASQSSLSTNWRYTVTGTYNPTINIDPDNTIAESNENNNQASIGTIICSQQGSNIVCTKQ
jgi:hypothetical protein